MVQVKEQKLAIARKPRGRTAVRLPEDPRSRDLEVKKPIVIKQVAKRGDDVRERIFQAALQFFGTFGFEGTSTRAIAERAGVTHTLVLYHFQSKDELWRSTVERALHDYMLVIEAKDVNKPEQSASAELRTFIERFVRLSAATPQVHSILRMESSHGNERMRWVIDSFSRGHFTKIRDLIRRGQLDGDVREGDPARLYYHILGAGGTPFTIATEYKELTGRDIFSETEILRTIAFIYDIVFV